MLIRLSFLTFIYPSCTRYHYSNNATDVYVAMFFMSYKHMPFLLASGALLESHRLHELNAKCDKPSLLSF